MAQQRQKTEIHPQSSCEKDLFIYLPWSFSLEGRLQVCHTYKGCWNTPREVELGNAIFLLFLSLAINCCYLSERSLYSDLESWFFCESHPVCTSRSLSLEARRIYNWYPTWCIFSYLKSCSLRVWLPISLKLGTKWALSAWNTERSWHTLNNWNFSRMNQFT